ncbi:hypothetical protein JOL62DRAFT_592910 [Phyllosticta paracitricarpa]|uniref:Alpha/beta hydrolase n=1 Tax=Phyllosticta paracitricarpa TaxID=2016321 RepID=A0ABR1N4W1_9PEZI
MGGGVVGGLHRPATGAAEAGLAVYVMHAEQDYLTFYACTGLAERGYHVFCANNQARMSGYISDIDFEEMLENAALGVSYLRNQTDINQVVLLGHSGGGAGPQKLYPCSDALATLPAADGVVLMGANLGISSMFLLRLNLFSPANGWTANGANYTASFIKEFQYKVALRMNRLVKCNGTSTTQAVRSARVPSGVSSIANSFLDGAVKTTIRGFLGIFALRVDAAAFGYDADSVEGIQWNSSHMVPLLTMGMTGHYEYLNAEKVYLNSGNNDTSIVFFEGANHDTSTCIESESSPGEFGNTTVAAFHHVAQWLGKQSRFLSA